MTLFMSVKVQKMDPWTLLYTENICLKSCIHYVNQPSMSSHYILSSSNLLSLHKSICKHRICLHRVAFPRMSSCSLARNITFHSFSNGSSCLILWQVQGNFHCCKMFNSCLIFLSRKISLLYLSSTHLVICFLP